MSTPRSTAEVPIDKYLVPEALIISALIDEGTYRPERFGLTSDMFRAHTSVHNFCSQHQETTGKAPDINLVKRKYPTFSYSANIDPRYAANLLIENHASHLLRKTLRDSSMTLNDDEPDIKHAMGLLESTLRSLRLHSLPETAAFTDPEEHDPFATAPPHSVDLLGPNGAVPPKRPLTTITGGGIRPGNLWYVAARLGVGKSWRLMSMAVAAAEAGSQVTYYSLEMTKAEVIARLRQIATRHITDPHLSDSEKMDMWRSTFEGNINVYDPRNGPLDVTVIAANHDETARSLTIVDYIGLMRTKSGSRAIEDWRAAATISNQLKEIALEYGIPIISAAQVNRAGASSDGAKTAKSEHIAQSDALGQDADLLLMLAPHCRTVHVNVITKNRHGIHGSRWFSAFDPVLGQFDYMSQEKADQMKEQEEEKEQL